MKFSISFKKFQGHKLPAASELKWIVSELDAPQELLPLPTAWPISADSHLKDEHYERGVHAGISKMSMPVCLMDVISLFRYLT